ncbi:MAG: hypothetical protein EA402_05945 [Planctomycetota bacterium]|nr:MAG: hypothetical protein EA402_05945 [Planctomycetota bacterium]
MSSASMLSDMLSGRIRGQRYRPPLAKWLGISLAWLEGSDAPEHCPEWALLPAAAYERWLRRVRIAWQAWCIDQRGGPSATTAMGLRLSHSGGFRLSAEERAHLAELLDLDADDAILNALSRGQWHAIPFAMQLAIAEELGAPAPENPEHLAQGHRSLQDAAEDRAWVDSRYRDQWLRYHLPPRLFQLTRLALVGLLAQRQYQGKDVEAVRDCLELLWRQQLQRRGEEAPNPPAACQEETGRARWTRIDELLARHADDGEASGDDPYRSLPPPSS